MGLEESPLIRNAGTVPLEDVLHGLAIEAEEKGPEGVEDFRSQLMRTLAELDVDYTGPSLKDRAAQLNGKRKGSVSSTTKSAAQSPVTRKVA